MHYGAAARGVALVVLRAPGIYAADRLPLERLRAGTPVLRDDDDVYTNHIHADDLAAICVRALDDAAPAGIYNASRRQRSSRWAIGSIWSPTAPGCRARRACRAREAAGRMPPALLSFMSESRRLDNTRLKRDARRALRYPTVAGGPGA